MSSFPLRPLLFGAVALALGGGTLLLGQDLLQVRGAVARPAMNTSVVASRTILIATRTLALGSLVKAGDLAWRDWPVTAIDPAYIAGHSRKLESFTGSLVRAEILPGEPITAARLAGAGSQSALAAVTSPGRRAVSVALTPTSGVSGLIAPGDRVDVVLTYTLPRLASAAGGAAFERRAATTILTDLRVLAIDQRLSGQGVDTKDIHNASLEVTAKQSEALALAADLGKLSLSLRGSEPPASDTLSGKSSSTIDYEVGRLLPGLGRPVGGNTGNAGQKRFAPPVLTEFHGSKSNAVGPVS